MRQFATNEREAKAAGGACSSRGPLLTGDARARAKPSCMECGVVLGLGSPGLATRAPSVRRMAAGAGE